MLKILEHAASAGYGAPGWSKSSNAERLIYYPRKREKENPTMTMYLPGGVWTYMDKGTLTLNYNGDGKGGLIGELNLGDGTPPAGIIQGNWTEATGEVTFVTDEPKTYDGSLREPRLPYPEYGVYKLAGTIKDTSGTFLGTWSAKQTVVP